MYDLESRWKLNGKYIEYYGIRKLPYLLKNRIRVNAKQREIMEKLPKVELTKSEISVLGGLFGKQVVDVKDKKRVPASLEEATFCKTCAANDFMIPGLEFDDNGVCPICASVENVKSFKSLVPVKNTFETCKRSRFDVAVFYTGGKDSTYLLYYLAKVLRLRVLALTWEIPYMSDSAKKSIEGAKKSFDTVEFITRRVSDADLKVIYSELFRLSGNTCACPSLAYVLFYPELVINRVPYFVAGNEPAQILGLYYNGMAPAIAYGFAENKFLNAMINVGRVLTLRKPFKSGQFQTLATMKQLAYGDSWLKKIAGYKNELVDNIVKAISKVDNLVKPLKRAIRSSSFSGNIPAFVQVDFNEICGGTYEWRKVKDVIERECGWVAPEDTGKGLHTSCKIEKCKEHTQFVRFYNMKSKMIPFSALEISIASRSRNLTKEQAIDEIKNSLGFSLERIPECLIMEEYFKR